MHLSDIKVTDIFQSFTYKMAAKINWHRYRTKLRHCHPMYKLDRIVKVLRTCQIHANITVVVHKIIFVIIYNLLCQLLCRYFYYFYFKHLRFR